ncbi:MAG: helix-turn-helix domain-containing protein [Solirubrobacterales bacterium]|nr:helix-turn-helix domain-containing protein [Solirubrobacterales bacterium]
MKSKIESPSPSSSALRELRRRRGLTQQSLAEAAGCSISYVQFAERGYSPVTSGEKFDAIIAVLTQKNGRPVTTPDVREESARTGRHDSA